MKKIALLIAVALLSSLVFSTAALAEKKPEFTLKLGHLANTEHTWHKGSVKFAELVEEKTGGRVVVQVFLLSMVPFGGPGVGVAGGVLDFVKWSAPIQG